MKNHFTLHVSLILITLYIFLSFTYYVISISNNAVLLDFVFDARFFLFKTWSFSNGFPFLSAILIIWERENHSNPRVIKGIFAITAFLVLFEPLLNNIFVTTLFAVSVALQLTYIILELAPQNNSEF